MYRFLLTRRWVGGLALALAAAVGCVLLGTWQWGRHEQRVARNALVVQNYDRAAVDADRLLPAEPAGWELPVAATWTPVRLLGTYAPVDTVLVRNRPLDGSPGYHVLVPMDAAPGLRVLVDRGWVPAGEDGDRPDSVPAPPSGTVEAVVRLRPVEAASDRVAPPGQTYRIAPAALSPAAAGGAGRPLVTGAYGELAAEFPRPREAPVLLPRPEQEEGPHLSYALQWGMFAMLALAGFVVVARRTAHEDEHDGDGGDGGDGAHGRADRDDRDDRDDRAAGPSAGSDPPRRTTSWGRGERVSDEDVEDAAVEEAAARAAAVRAAAAGSGDPS